MIPYKEFVGNRIKARRIELGFAKQDDLAKKLGTDRSRVSRWESGESLPDGLYKERLLKALDLGESELFDIPDSAPSVIAASGPPAPDEEPPAHDMIAVQKSLEFLQKFVGLPPDIQSIVLAVTYNDPTYLARVNFGRVPKWLALLAQASERRP